MAKTLNVSYREFRKNVAGKIIFLWGAGKLASYYIRTFCKGLNIAALIDKNETICGKELEVDEYKYFVISEHEFLKRLKNDFTLRKYIAIFITPTAYTGEIIKHINKISLLNDIECYAGVLMRDYYEESPFPFTVGEQKIPKKIHYCWFGRKDIPKHLKVYMESWYKYCPSYEIIRWDETNYDVSKNRYMREAYESKMWGFVSDYARLDIIYNEGGIYLDTDVELLTSMDRLLNDEMFCGFQGNFQINTGCGFGAVKKHALIRKMRDYYEEQTFYLEGGELNLKACYEYQNPVLEEFGFQLENIYQKKNGVILYPSEVLAPSNGLISSHYTENTVSIHHLEYSWGGEKKKMAYDLFKREITDLLMQSERVERC